MPHLVTWIDEREDAFPTDLPGNVTIEASAEPRHDEMDATPRGRRSFW